MGAPVVHWEINSNDAERLQAFYSKLFDWKINSKNPMRYGLVNTGNKSGANGGIGPNDPNQPGPAVTFYVAVRDLQQALSKAVGLGGTIVMPPTEIPNMVTMAMFRDPDGNVIGMVKDQPMPKKKKVGKKPAKKKPAAKKSTKKSRASLRRRR
jgi:uncharacterized protein